MQRARTCRVAFVKKCPSKEVSNEQCLAFAQKQYDWFLNATPADIQYLADLPFSLSVPSHGVLVVHAGLVPGIPLPRQSLYDLIEARLHPHGSHWRSCDSAWWRGGGCGSHTRWLGLLGILLLRQSVYGPAKVAVAPLLTESV